jgi:excisionase family DNA binding protein
MTTVVYNGAMTKFKGYMTTAEAAEYLDITPAGVRQHIRRGNLPGAEKRFGGAWLIPVSSVEAIEDVKPGRPKGKQSSS